jgi:hypothetical protein
VLVICGLLSVPDPPTMRVLRHASSGAGSAVALSAIIKALDAARRKR